MARCRYQERRWGGVVRPRETEVCARVPERSMEEVPMCRYVNPIPPYVRGVDCIRREDGVLWTRVLEENCRQNQLLVDLLGAVNALTAALLSTRLQG